MAQSNVNLHTGTSQNLVGRSLAEYAQSNEGRKPTHNKNESGQTFHSVSQKNLTRAVNSAQGASSTRIGSASGYSLRKFDPTDALNHQRMLA